MQSMEITLLNGRKEKVLGFKFTHYIQNVGFDFFVHDSLLYRERAITHYLSGKRVMWMKYLGPNNRSMVVKAAKKAINRMVTLTGAEKVLSTLREAEAADKAKCSLKESNGI